MIGKVVSFDVTNFFSFIQSIDDENIIENILPTNHS